MDHDPEYEAGRRRRETLLMMLTSVFAGGILFFLILVSGGFFLFVAAAVLAIGVVGTLHYLLWGQSLSQEVAGEREEAEDRARWEAQEQERFWERPSRF